MFYEQAVFPTMRGIQINRWYKFVSGSSYVINDTTWDLEDIHVSLRTLARVIMEARLALDFFPVDQC